MKKRISHFENILCEFHSISKSIYDEPYIYMLGDQMFCVSKCARWVEKKGDKNTANVQIWETKRNDFCIWIGLNWIELDLVFDVFAGHQILFRMPLMRFISRKEKCNETKRKRRIRALLCDTSEWKAICSTLKEKRKGSEELKNIWINTVRVCGIKVEKKMKRTKTIQLHGWIQFDVIIIII